MASRPEEQAGYSKRQEDKDYLSEPPQPDVGTFQIPNFTDTRVHQGVRYFPPIIREGAPVQILGIGMAVLPEEATGLAETVNEKNIVLNKGRLLKGPSGQMFKDMLRKQPHLTWDRFAYMTVIPWLLPKNRRYSPTKEEIEWCKPRVLTTIAKMKPEAIVVFGKKIFDLLVDEKISYDDARGAWFDHGDDKIPVYLMDPVNFLITKPWTFETFCTDFREVNRFFNGKRTDIEVQEPPKFHEIRTFEQLDQLVQRWEHEKLYVQSVDCEWSGTHHVDGGLRSIQFAWAAREGAYLNFFDHTGQFHLGTDYKRCGEILGRFLNKPEVKYLGHHYAADSPWMETWLNLEVLGKCRFDSEYAQQTVDEYAPLGLEWMAMRYTDFGRYDMPLVRWKRANKALMKADEGYGKIPDEIMIPYACLDTLTVLQAEKPIRDQLYFQELTEYFDRTLLPFVTDIYHTFVTVGLPVDRNLFEQTRAFMNWAYRTLLANFKQGIVDQADELLVKHTGFPAQVLEVWKMMGQKQSMEAVEKSIHDMVGDEFWEARGKHLFGHWRDVKDFNIRSTDHVRRWVYGCLGLTPIKSTAKKEQGLPSMPWEKVLELPAAQQKMINPSVDKETMEILQDNDPMIARLLAVSNVGNLCKGFLKEGDRDQDGELVEENGLAKFIASDCRIHGQYSLTETGRPRAWKPNVLNFPSYLNKGVAAGLSAILGKQKDGSFLDIPTEFEDLIGTPEERATIPMKDLLKDRMPTIRSCIAAPQGMIYTVRGL